MLECTCKSGSFALSFLTCKKSCSECLSVALVVQHSKRMSLILSSSLASVAPPHFFHIISWNVRFSGKKLLNITKCVFRFSTTFSEILVLLILRRIQRDIVCLRFHPVRVIREFNQISIICSDFFSKYKNTKFNENTSSEGRVVPSRWMDGRTDRQTWQVYNRLEQFCERAKKGLI